MRADVLDQRLDEEAVARPGATGARKTEDTEVLREARPLRLRLGANDALAGGEPDVAKRIDAEPMRAFERQDVGRVGDDLRAAQRGHDFVLAGEAVREQTPSGASGDNSIASKAEAAASRWLSSATRVR